MFPSALLAHDLVRTFGTRRVLDGVSLTASPGHRDRPDRRERRRQVDPAAAARRHRRARDRHRRAPADLGFLHQEMPFDAGRDDRRRARRRAARGPRGPRRAGPARPGALADAAGLAGLAELLAEYGERLERAQLQRRVGRRPAGRPGPRRARPRRPGARPHARLAVRRAARPARARRAADPPARARCCSTSPPTTSTTTPPPSWRRSCATCPASSCCQPRPRLPRRRLHRPDRPRPGRGRSRPATAATTPPTRPHKRAERERWQRRFAEEQEELAELRRCGRGDRAPGRARPRTARQREDGLRPHRRAGPEPDLPPGPQRRPPARRAGAHPGPQTAGTAAVPRSGAWPRAPTTACWCPCGDVRVPGRLDARRSMSRPPTGSWSRAPTARASRRCSPCSPAGCPPTATVRRRRGPAVGLLAQDTVFDRPDRTARETYELALGAERAEAVPLRSLGPARTRGTWTGRSGSCRSASAAGSRWRCWSRDPPELLLLDEPTNHLSPRLVRRAGGGAGHRARRDRRRQPRPLAALPLAGPRTPPDRRKRAGQRGVTAMRREANRFDG